MEKLFIGIKGQIVCLNRETGKSLWVKKLKAFADLTNVHFDGTYLYAASKGYLYCLNPEDGTILWENPLNGLGSGPCIIASEATASAVVAADANAQQSAAAAAVMLTTAGGSATD